MIGDILFSQINHYQLSRPMMAHTGHSCETCGSPKIKFIGPFWGIHISPEIEQWTCEHGPKLELTIDTVIVGPLIFA